MAEAKKYYWLKLKRDFFKRHDTKIIRGMENGEKYLIFYLTLLVESIDHEGKLRFSDTVPYNDSMLATITDTDIDIVRSAVKIFCELGMMECFDDGTLYMSKVAEMIGDETEWAEKKRLYRESQRTIDGQKRTLSDKSKRLELELEKEKEIDKKENMADKPPRLTFIKPTFEEIKEYCQERKNSVDPCRFLDFYESKGWMVGKNKMKDWRAAVRTWERDDSPKPVKAPKAPVLPICPVCGTTGLRARQSFCPKCKYLLEPDCMADKEAVADWKKEWEAKNERA